MTKKSYVPDHGDIVLIDHDPVRKGEIGKYRPALVLSTKQFNRTSGKVITCPISTSIRGTPVEVPIMLERQSVIVAYYPQTMAWKERGTKFLQKADPEIVAQTLNILAGLMKMDRYI